MPNSFLEGMQINGGKLPLRLSRNDEESLTDSHVSLYEFTHGLAVKKAKTREAQQLLAKEAQWLQYLEKNFRSDDFFVPRLIYYKDNILIEDKVNGKPLLEVDALTGSDQIISGVIDALHRQSPPKCGEDQYKKTSQFLNQLHAVGRTVEKTPLSRVPEYEWSLTILNKKTSDEAQEKVALQLKRWADVKANNLSFCHGDPSPIHFFSDGKVMSLIDFNASRITSPALDFGVYAANILSHIGLIDCAPSKNIRLAKNRISQILANNKVHEPTLINFFMGTSLILKSAFARNKGEETYLLETACKLLGLYTFDTKRLLEAIE